MGAPKLTDELTARVCEYIGQGQGTQEACERSGIARRTYFDWRQQGQEALDRGDTESPYAKFLDATRAAEAAFEAHHLKTIVEAAEAGPRTWTAAAWLLERRWPQRWGLRNRQEITGPNGEPVKVVFAWSDKADENSNGESTPAA